MGIFRFIGAVATDIVSEQGTRFVMSHVFGNYSIYLVCSTVAYFIATLLYIPSFIALDIASAILMLIPFIILVVFIFKYALKLFSMLRGRRRYAKKAYGMYKMTAINSAKREAISWIPIFALLLVIAIAVFILDLFILSKTRLKNVEISKLSLFFYPVFLSIDTIFRTNFCSMLIK